jgi:hypothetical protein
MLKRWQRIICTELPGFARPSEITESGSMTAITSSYTTIVPAGGSGAIEQRSCCTVWPGAIKALIS